MKSAAWDSLYGSQQGSRWWPCEELVRFIGARTCGRILEIGCGNGANLWYLAEHANEVVGVDFSGAALSLAGEYLAKRRVTNCKLRSIDISRGLDPNLGQFDIVVDCMTSQHLAWASHLELYQGVWGRLNAGGLFFLYHLDWFTTGKAVRVGTHKFDSRIDLFPDVELVCLPYPSALVQVVTDAGFTRTYRRGLTRDYGTKQASYTIIEAVKGVK